MSGSQEHTSREVLVLGIGNLLMGDEGVGIHAMEYMMKKPFSEDVMFLDGGTGGFPLLSCLQDHKRVIIIDAGLDDRPPGEVRVLRPRYSSDFPKTLGAHDIGLKDLIESATLLEKMPEIYLIIITIRLQDELTMTLSPEIKKTLPRIEQLVRQILENPPKGE